MTIRFSKGYVRQEYSLPRRLGRKDSRQQRFQLSNQCKQMVAVKFGSVQSRDFGYQHAVLAPCNR